MSQSLRQIFLKRVYPFFMAFTKRTGRGRIIKNLEMQQPPISFYSLSITLNNKSVFEFAPLKGKKVLLVNTASDCGYTAQYSELQNLYDQYKNSLVIIGFPSNDFKEQEKGNDSEIAKFCEENFKISFPLAAKGSVSKGIEQNKIYGWLTSKMQNGWNEQAPVWNFSKYLINEEGVLTHYFDPAISPMDKEITNAVNLKINRITT
jgi:glutathione peroxidase